MTYAYIRRQIEGLGHTKFQARKQLFLYTIRLTTSHAGCFSVVVVGATTSFVRFRSTVKPEVAVDDV